MERFYTFVFVAGLGCFAVAFVLSMIFPWMSLESYHGMEYKALEELAARPSAEFVELSKSYPDDFARAFGAGGATSAAYADALQRGRDLYVGQACWHCHSQYVRPVANEDVRFGDVSFAQEYQNALSQPHLWGTRRVGPDLAREHGKHTNDWHVAHFINPKNVVANSVMPRYDFYFSFDGEGRVHPSKDALSLIAYVQWLGTETGRRER